MSIATCHTPDCGNGGIPIDVGNLSPTDENGEPLPGSPFPVACGVCGQQITDVDHGDGGTDPDPPQIDNTLPESQA